MNVPTQRGVKPQQIGQPTTGDVNNAADVLNAEVLAAACCVEEVDHRVAVDSCRREKHLTEGGFAFGPSHEVPIGVFGLKRSLVGVGSPTWLTIFEPVNTRWNERRRRADR